MSNLSRRGVGLFVGAWVAIGCSSGPAPDEREGTEASEQKLASETSAPGAKASSSKAERSECGGPGASCEHSWDCCNSWCTSDGTCHIGAGECGGPGANCEHSWDCCGRWCTSNGTCHIGAGECGGTGARCEHSWDCCSRWCTSEGKCHR